MTHTVEKLRKMRAAAREKILAENPELRKAWENREALKVISEAEMRKQDAAYLREGNM